MCRGLWATDIHPLGFQLACPPPPPPGGSWPVTREWRRGARRGSLRQARPRGVMTSPRRSDGQSRSACARAWAERCSGACAIGQGELWPPAARARGMTTPQSSCSPSDQPAAAEAGVWAAELTTHATHSRPLVRRCFRHLSSAPAPAPAPRSPSRLRPRASWRPWVVPGAWDRRNAGPRCLIRGVALPGELGAEA